MTAPITEKYIEKEPPKGALDARLFLIAMPKCGLHALVSAVKPLAAVWVDRPWLGSYNGMGWKTTTVYAYIKRMEQALAEQPNGTFIRGHVKPHPRIIKAMYDNGTIPIFIYRNLRDVAVSSAYHILDAGTQKGDGKIHFNPQPFKDLESFDDVLEAVIRGYAGMPSLVDRWNEFRGWLDVRWILRIRYEDLVDDFYAAAVLIFRYISGTATRFAYGEEYKPVFDRHTMDEIARDMRMSFGMKHESVTFRRGVAGGWVDDWSEQAERAFVETGALQANRELGYE